MGGTRELTLAIEISNPGGASESGGATARAGVAVGEGREPGSARVLGVEWLRPASRHDDALMPSIDALCRRLGVRPGELSRVAVSAGPGGYTSLRIAVTTAKLLCEATGAACIAVPTTLALAHSAAVRMGRVVIGLAWKDASAWRQRFELTGGVRAVDQGSLATLERFSVSREELLIADAELEQRLRNAGGIEPGATVLRPSFDPASVFRASLDLAAIDPQALAPIYPREPEAVSKWRALHPESGV